jgi:hypothetical protein
MIKVNCLDGEHDNINSIKIKKERKKMKAGKTIQHSSISIKKKYAFR